jgi:imidazole glycerol phosphate synthase subunit HisF
MIRAYSERREAPSMDYVKIIPGINIKNGKVVKCDHYIGLRIAGDHMENAVFY